MIDVAVLLAGCGMYDGSEPQETVLLLWALAARGARVLAVAPGVDQLHVVNHLDGEEAPGVRRRVAEEAARLSRGRIDLLDAFEPAAADALAIPGGYGVGKNLMTGFAVPGERPALRPDVERLLRHFLGARKPVGVISVARLLLESAIPDAFTGRLREERAEEAYPDAERRIVYTPGFLVGDRLDRIARGVDALAAQLVRWGAEEA
jgi:enhancing lycopene biosynthesis protein 2